ncbi:hypothetical protein DDF62_01910 [Caulobacter radicis]|uniref:hypothetical protein n=1 Tax=Caulobacter radicis TaxID=2172650 RepID=UPI000D57571E|nr:hypothetical protein [Caulobacter radicis]PVM93110.1 hypothetical protein DDF62_01910 [Caulobacter radicis]
MARHHGHHHEGAWSGAALLTVLVLVALLVYAVWQSGLLAVRPDIADLRLPNLAPPTMPTPNPEPLPSPVPRPG